MNAVPGWQGWKPSNMKENPSTYLSILIQAEHNVSFQNTTSKLVMAGTYVTLHRSPIYTGYIAIKPFHETWCFKLTAQQVTTALLCHSSSIAKMDTDKQDPW